MAATLGRDIGVIPWDTFLTQDWVPTEAGSLQEADKPARFLKMAGSPGSAGSLHRILIPTGTKPSLLTVQIEFFKNLN